MIINYMIDDLTNKKIKKNNFFIQTYLILI